MNKELETLITLKYGTVSTGYRYIINLPKPVREKLKLNLFFHSIEDVYNALVEYELGEKIPSVKYRVFLHRDS